MTFDKQAAKEHIEGWRDIPTITRHGRREQILKIIDLTDLLTAAIGHIEMLETQAAIWVSEHDGKDRK